jgi:hypothetical protein
MEPTTQASFTSLPGLTQTHIHGSTEVFPIPSPPDVGRKLKNLNVLEHQNIFS